MHESTSAGGSAVSRLQAHQVQQAPAGGQQQGSSWGPVCVPTAGVDFKLLKQGTLEHNSIQCELLSPASRKDHSTAAALQSARPRTLTCKNAAEENQVAEYHVSKVGSFHATDLIILVCEVWIVEGREICGTWEVHCCSGCCLLLLPGSEVLVSCKLALDSAFV